MVTNRFKAIVAQNLFCVFQFFFIYSMKIACNEKRVNTFDIILMANSTTLLASVIAVLAFGSKMSIDKRYRMALLIRCVVGGALGIACFSLGAVLIPMTL